MALSRSPIIDQQAYNKTFVPVLYKLLYPPFLFIFIYIYIYLYCIGLCIYHIFALISYTKGNYRLNDLLILKQEEKFIKYADGLRNMLASYHKVLSSLDSAEVKTYHM